MPVCGELQARVVGLGNGEFEGLAALDLLQPQLRRLAVLIQVDGCYGIAEPFAVGRDSRRAQALHLHHVLEGHGTFGVTGRGLARSLGWCESGSRKDEGKQAGN